MTPSDNSTDLDQRLSRLEAVFNTHQGETSTSFGELRGLTSKLLEIAQLHQQALRQEQINQQRNDDRFREMREDIQQIWQYLVGQ